MKRQYIGNSYITNFYDFRIDVEAPLLIMYGNVAICSLYPKILKYLYSKFEYIIIILGPFEYCGSTISQTDSFIRIICTEFKNINFLQRDQLLIGNELFIGTTLWSYIPKGSGIYECSYLDRILQFDVDSNNKLFHKNVEWLEKILSKYGTGNRTTDEEKERDNERDNERDRKIKNSYIRIVLNKTIKILQCMKNWKRKTKRTTSVTISTFHSPSMDYFDVEHPFLCCSDIEYLCSSNHEWICNPTAPYNARYKKYNKNNNKNNKTLK
jgi:hypothetical protein